MHLRIVGVTRMSLYETLPTDFLLQFYHGINKNIVKGSVSKDSYYELGLIIAAAAKRGMSLGTLEDFKEIVDEQILMDLDNE
jgi:hypothetical protein